MPAAVLVLEGKGRAVRGLGPHLQDEASSMPGRSWGDGPLTAAGGVGEESAAANKART